MSSLVILPCQAHATIAAYVGILSPILPAFKLVNLTK